MFTDAEMLELISLNTRMCKRYEREGRLVLVFILNCDKYTVTDTGRGYTLIQGGKDRPFGRPRTVLGRNMSANEVLVAINLIKEAA